MKKFRGSYLDYTSSPIGQTERFQLYSQDQIDQIENNPKMKMLYCEEDPLVGSGRYHRKMEVKTGGAWSGTAIDLQLGSGGESDRNRFQIGTKGGQPVFYDPMNGEVFTIYSLLSGMGTARHLVVTIDVKLTFAEIKELLS